jgi:hypothetical protein
MVKDRIASIELKPSTKDRIKNLGKKGDTYDDIVQRLLLAYEKNAGTNNDNN